MSKKITKSYIDLGRGRLKLPFFMPDATRGLVKSISAQEALIAGTKAMVVNTLHLYLQPGLQKIEAAGGLHAFMNWPYYLLSDSGGFQVFSLIYGNSKLGKIYDDRVVFKSPIDGKEHDLTPEKSIQIQFSLGTDMMVVLDDCLPYNNSQRDLEKSVERTIDWAKRSKEEYLRQLKKRKIEIAKAPLLFAVVQGGEDIALRKHCFKELEKIGFDGFGFGGRPVNSQGKFLHKLLKETALVIGDKYLKFALGIGTISDIYKCRQMGWDMFDCVIPTREGRHGRLLIPAKNLRSPKIININNAKFATNFKKINKDSKFKEVSENSLAYLHHLFKIKEPLGARIATLNNLEYYQKFLRSRVK
ncbi:MAG: tRNA-guanine transglycosylase [Candidatus Pacebacteria bacterium]|nr:tRNA-guanine transglycosylase [Candidatus Paceibacterota bacterium]